MKNRYYRQPEEVGTKADEGNKKGDSSAGGFQVVFESGLLLLLLLSAPALTLVQVSKIKSYSGLGFMILYFSISGITCYGGSIPSEVMKLSDCEIATFSL